LTARAPSRAAFSGGKVANGQGNLVQILHVNTYDNLGGAARAAFRLHRGLLDAGAGSSLLVRRKRSGDDTVLTADGEQPSIGNEETLAYIDLVREHYIQRFRTPLSNTLFSFPYPGLDVSALPAVQSCDVINLHWVSDFQSPLSLARLFRMGKPIVWTLHDQEAFTGGCHYSAGCHGYRHRCRDCPQLAADPYGLPAAVLGDKRALIEDADLTIVAPSHWMGASARSSSLFSKLRIEVIPNGLETSRFVPSDRTDAKNRLGLAPAQR
jgi:glycosyltransferase involved in cell wall biosynthesis